MFKNIRRWITGVIGDLAKLLEKPASDAVKIVNVIREYIDHPAVDIFTMFTRTGIDEKIVTKLRVVLPEVLAFMMKGEGLVQAIGGWHGDVGTLLRILSEHLSKLSKDAKAKWWTELAALILQEIADRTVEKPVAVVATQGAYLKSGAVA